MGLWSLSPGPAVFALTAARVDGSEHNPWPTGSAEHSLRCFPAGTTSRCDTCASALTHMESPGDEEKEVHIKNLLHSLSGSC